MSKHNPTTDAMHDWCEESADLMEKWAREQEDQDTKVALLRVCDACCDVMDLLEEGEGDED